jgi:RNA polymerase sigma-70 factor (ECF subfamily)
MALQKPDTDELLRRADQGDSSAVGSLLDRHRARLRHMVAVRIDPRLAARVDPSDVVQETLAEAAHKLPEYLRRRPLAFYPWLRRIAWDKLVDMHTRHVAAQKRSVTRETPIHLDLSDHSTMQLIDQLAASGTSPSRRLLLKEMRERVREALQQLSPRDREVLVLRHLEQLTLKETAQVLGITEAAVQSRYRRAVERLHAILK